MALRNCSLCAALSRPARKVFTIGSGVPLGANMPTQK